jgi:hypothetical protein
MVTYIHAPGGKNAEHINVAFDIDMTFEDAVKWRDRLSELITTKYVGSQVVNSDYAVALRVFNEYSKQDDDTLAFVDFKTFVLQRLNAAQGQPITNNG